MTLDATSAAVLTAVITALVHVLSRVPDWITKHRRQEVERAKTDAEIAVELRDELYREVRTLRSEMTAVQAALATCERNSNLLQIENDRLEAQNQARTQEIAVLRAEVAALRNIIERGRYEREAE